LKTAAAGTVRQLDETTLGVFIVPPVGGVERKITETASQGYWTLQQFHRRLDWTPDSRHVVVSVPEHAGGPEGLLLVGINDGEKRWLSNPLDPLIGDREPAVSPDGRMVAFARGRPGADTQVYLLPLSTGLRPAGAPRQLAGAAHARSPAWTADGTRIVFTSITPIAFGSGVSVVGVNSGAAPRRLLALGRNTAVPAMARTGRLAYSRVVMEGNIWRQEIPAGTGAVLPPLKLTDSSAQDFNERCRR
jgi:Tol biopolymer transport system component